MKKLAVFLIILGFLSRGHAGLPELYGAVSSVCWVVRDLDKVVRGWRKLGFDQVIQEDHLVFRKEGGEAAVKARVATGYLGDVRVIWIEPAGENLFSKFLSRDGEGIFSLNHRAGSARIAEIETGRLQKLGVGVLESLELETGTGVFSFSFFNTEEHGKYVLALEQGPDISGKAPAYPSPFIRTAQFAFVIRDMKAVSAFWNRLGFEEFEITHPTLGHLRYRGKPGKFDQQLGWQRHGRADYEWIVPLKGPTTYQDALDAHGEGFHHLAFEVTDVDLVLKRWAEAGFPEVQSGTWGEMGQPGSGRFAYADTDSIGGVTIELLWNHR